MEKFPILKVHQVALMRADARTGHVLDEQFNLASTEDQKVYTIFEDVDLALNYAKSKILSMKSIECVIYDSNEQVKFFISPQNIGSYI